MSVHLIAPVREAVELREHLLQFRDRRGVADIATAPGLEGGSPPGRETLLALGQPGHRLRLDGRTIPGLGVGRRLHRVPFFPAAASSRPRARKNWAQSSTPFMRWTRTVAAAKPRCAAISAAESPST